MKHIIAVSGLLAALSATPASAAGVEFDCMFKLGFGGHGTSPQSLPAAQYAQVKACANGTVARQNGAQAIPVSAGGKSKRRH